MVATVEFFHVIRDEENEAKSGPTSIRGTSAARAVGSIDGQGENETVAELAQWRFQWPHPVRDFEKPRLESDSSDDFRFGVRATILRSDEGNDSCAIGLDG